MISKSRGSAVRITKLAMLIPPASVDKTGLRPRAGKEHRAERASKRTPVRRKDILYCGVNHILIILLQAARPSRGQLRG
jgi:hypothetical protein